MKQIFFTLVFMFSVSLLANSQEINFSSYRAEIAAKPEHTYYELQKVFKSEKRLKEKAKLSVILSELAYYIDQPEHILGYVEEAIAGELLDDSWYVRAQISKARAHYQRREYELHMVTAQAAYNKAKQQDLPVLETAALLEMVLADLGLDKTYLAENSLLLLDKYLSFLSDDFGKAVLLQRYSTVLHKQNLYTKAQKALDDTIKIFEKVNGLHFISVSYYNSGRIEGYQGRYQQAIKAMKVSYQWAIKDNNYLNQAFSLSRMAEYQERLNQLELAKKSLVLAKESALKAKSSRVQLLAYKNIAEFTCRHESSDNCYQHLDKAISHAITNELLRDKSDLQRYLAEQYANNGLYQKAYHTLQLSLR